MRSKKRIGKEVYQFAHNPEWVFDNTQGAVRRTFHERDDQGNPTKRFELKDTGRVKRIYPVIIHHDFSLRLNCVTKIIAAFFQEEIAKKRVHRKLVRPLSLLSIEEVEVIIPYLTAIPLPDILEEYAKYDDPLTTFDRIFSAFLRRRRTKSRRNEWIDRRSDEIWQQMRDLFVDLSD